MAHDHGTGSAKWIFQPVYRCLEDLRGQAAGLFIMSAARYGLFFR
jgi:hypothetical protein